MGEGKFLVVTRKFTGQRGGSFSIGWGRGRRKGRLLCFKEGNIFASA